jgi:nitrogenase molybdenum-iron protein alpha chain
MPTIPSKTIAIAERRLGTIDAYYGPAEPLIEGFKDGQYFAQRIRTLSQTKGDEITSVIRLLHQIKDTVTIVHGARGCSSILHFLEAYDGKGAPVFSTNLTEDNSIMGAEEKLRTVILAAFERYNPKAVFVVTTPIVAINNDDVQSVAAELGEELNIPVIPIYSDGFKSKIAANGYDIAFLALAGYLVPEAAETEKELVNIITSIEHKEDIDYLAAAVNTLKLKPNIFPRYSDINSFKNSSGASSSIGLRTESRVLGEFLEKERKVPFYLLPPPIGIAGTSRWLGSLADKYGRQKETQELISLNERRIKENSELEPVLNLGGKKVYVSGETVVAIALAELVKEFGGEVAGLTLSSLDKNTAIILEESIRKNGWNFNIHIGDGQVFEQANILLRLKPDIYLGELGQAVHAARLGIPSVDYSALPLYGYDSAVNLIKKIIQAYSNKSFVEKLASLGSGYSDSWLGKNPNWYIKQEVG